MNRRLRRDPGRDRRDHRRCRDEAVATIGGHTRVSCMDRSNERRSLPGCRLSRKAEAPTIRYADAALGGGRTRAMRPARVVTGLGSRREGLHSTRMNLRGFGCPSSRWPRAPVACSGSWNPERREQVTIAAPDHHIAADRVTAQPQWDRLRQEADGDGEWTAKRPGTCMAARRPRLRVTGGDMSVLSSTRNPRRAEGTALHHQGLRGADEAPSCVCQAGGESDPATKEPSSRVST
jgi:hypothetical protein